MIKFIASTALRTMMVEDENGETPTNEPTVLEPIYWLDIIKIPYKNHTNDD